jgi:hypothetical protein
MQHSRFILPIAAAITIYSQVAVANDYRVYSAAGELPEQRMSRLADEQSAREAEQLAMAANQEYEQQRQALRRMPPPLPTASNTNNSLSGRSPLPTVSTAGAAPTRQIPLPSVNRDLAAVMAESVTIDVQDMRWEEIITSIMPNGWRTRFQRVGDSILEQRADVTITNASRQEVLHNLLSRAGLAMEPFPEFDVPLLIISKQNGAQ